MSNAVVIANVDKFLEKNPYFKGFQIFSCQFMFGHQEIKILWETIKVHFRPACGDFFFITFWIFPNSWFSSWFISKIFWIAVPVEVQRYFTAMVFRRAQYGLDVSTCWIISLRGWSPWVSGSCLCQALLRSFSDKLHFRPGYLVLWTWPHVVFFHGWRLR